MRHEYVAVELMFLHSGTAIRFLKRISGRKHLLLMRRSRRLTNITREHFHDLGTFLVGRIGTHFHLQNRVLT